MVKSMAVKQSETSKLQRLIYVGPTLKGYRLIKYQVFIGGYPKHIDDVFEACPQIKKLFVPVKDLVQAEKDIAMAGTPLNKYYKLAMEV